MRRAQLANSYLDIVRTLRNAVEGEETAADARARAVERFRTEINMVIGQYASSSRTQSMSNAWSAQPAACDVTERKIGILFDAVNGLVRAGKEAAVSNRDLSLHYLKCALELGPLWVESLAGDADR